MALNTHELYGIYPAVFGALTLAHVTSVDPPHGVQQMVVTPGGSVDPALILEVSRKPQFSFTAHDLASILGAISPISGLSITDAWKVQYQQKADGGTFASGSNHIRMSGTKGKLLIDSITAQQDQTRPADVILRFYPLWDGSSVDGNGEPLPISIAAAQALVGVPTVGGVYKLGPVVFEQTKLAGVQSATVRFGTGYDITSADGEKVARVGTIDSRGPVFEIDVHNLESMLVPNHGQLQATDGMDVYFRNANYADSASQHIKLSMVGGAYTTAPAATSDANKVMTRLTMTGAKPGATAIITVSLGVTLP